MVKKSARRSSADVSNADDVFQLYQDLNESEQYRFFELLYADPDSIYRQFVDRACQEWEGMVDRLRIRDLEARITEREAAAKEKEFEQAKKDIRMWKGALFQCVNVHNQMLRKETHKARNDEIRELLRQRLSPGRIRIKLKDTYPDITVNVIKSVKRRLRGVG
jgi:hypothetical protein